MPNKPQPVVFLRNKWNKMMQAGKLADQRVQYVTAVLVLLLVLVMLFAPPAVRPLEIPTPKDGQGGIGNTPQFAEVGVAKPQLEEKQIQKTPTEVLNPMPLWVQGERLVAFGWQQRLVHQDWRYHSGIDIAVSVDKPIGALWSGTVEQVYTDKQYGLTVVVRTDYGRIHYGTLNDVFTKPGDTLKRGDPIGTPGQSSSEPYLHVHLGVQQGDKFIDPETVLR